MMGMNQGEQVRRDWGLTIVVKSESGILPLPLEAILDVPVVRKLDPLMGRQRVMNLMRGIQIQLARFKSEDLASLFKKGWKWLEEGLPWDSDEVKDALKLVAFLHHFAQIPTLPVRAGFLFLLFVPGFDEKGWGWVSDGEFVLAQSFLGGVPKAIREKTTFTVFLLPWIGNLEDKDLLFFEVPSQEEMNEGVVIGTTQPKAEA